MPLQIKEIGQVVVFTNDAGGGPNEIQAPEHGEATFLVHSPGAVTAAWYYAANNIYDFPKIHSIYCQPDGTHVKLVVGGQPGHADARVALVVIAAYNA